MSRRSRWTLTGLVALPLLVAGAGAIYQTVSTNLDLARTPPPGQLVDIATHRVHIWCSGTGAPAVILESGLGGSAFTWGAVQPRLAASTRVCSYDRAGFGYSDEGPVPRTSGRIAEELGRVLDGAGIEQPVILVAASLGGLSARILASTQPGRVTGMVLVDASHEDQRRHLSAGGAQPVLPPAFGFVTRAASFGLLRLRNETLGSNPEAAHPSVRPFVRATIHRASRYRALYSETMAWDESAEQVRASRRILDIPLIVLTAGAWPEEGRQLHTDLQRDQVTLSSRACQIIAEGVGHDIVGEAPDLVIRAVRAVTDAVNSRGHSLAC